MREDLQTALEAMGEVVAELESRFAADLLQLRADMADKLAREIAALPEAEPGEPGRDGTDRILAAPIYAREGEACEANTVAQAAGGLWQSVRRTNGGPMDDPAGWRCLVPGIASIEHRQDLERRELVFGFRMADGHLHEVRGRMPATLLPPDYAARGWGVLAGDLLRDGAGEFERMALRDGADPDNPDHWQEFRIRGFRGQKGKPGDEGPPGPPGPGLLGMDMIEADGALAIVPRFADPKAEAAPIMVDMITADPLPGLQPIVGFAGPWEGRRTYRRGMVVSAQVGGQPRLLLSTRSDNNARPDDAAAWLVMI